MVVVCLYLFLTKSDIALFKNKGYHCSTPFSVPSQNALQKSTVIPSEFMDDLDIIM